MGAVAVILALVVMVRCVCVLHGMNYRRRTRNYVGWFGFGLSYAVLCIAAGGAALHIYQGAGYWGDWLWLLSSTGLIAFDRRAPRPEQPAAQAA